MSSHLGFIMLLPVYGSASRASLYGTTCNQNLSRVFAERLVYRFSLKLEEGFENCAWGCVNNLLCGAFSHVNGSCQQYTGDGNALATFEDKCKINEDCSYPRGFCLRGLCSCEIGYSFNFTERLCVKACTSYGSYLSV